jgi:hypothetical protein
MPGWAVRASDRKNSSSVDNYIQMGRRDPQVQGASDTRGNIIVVGQDVAVHLQTEEMTKVRQTYFIMKFSCTYSLRHKNLRCVDLRH